MTDTVAGPPPDTPQSRLYPARPLLAASIAVFRAGRVLLASRPNPPFAGVFSLPGGLVEPGETLAEAALRELREEVAVEARIVAFNTHVESIERDDDGRIKRHFVIASFVGAWIAGEGTPGPEAGAIVWAAPDEAATLPCTPGLADIVVGAHRIMAGAA